MVAKGPVGGQDWLFKGRKTAHNFFQHRRTAKASDDISQSGTPKPGCRAGKDKGNEGHAAAGPHKSCQRQDDFARNRETGIFLPKVFPLGIIRTYAFLYF